MQQTQAFLLECQQLKQLLVQVEDYHCKTRFKGWDVNTILRHLYSWNKALETAILNEAAFVKFAEMAAPAALNGQLTKFEQQLYPELQGQKLQQAWWHSCLSLKQQCEKLDPKQRISWVGPSMSARSAISARLMETWAHAQAIYDLLQQPRQEHDYIQNIAFLGINTFAWSFKVNRLGIPENMPQVILTAPSGEVWQWSDTHSEQSVTGLAVEFCQVVTQTRNIKDTQLQVTGDVAKKWMQIAQCFAGRAEAPPAKGQRLTHQS